MSESLEATATKIENERARKRIALGMLASAPVLASASKQNIDGSSIIDTR